MTVRELIESLQGLPKSAMDAQVTLAGYEDNEPIADVRYEYGEVVIEADHDEDGDDYDYDDIDEGPK